MNEFSEIKTILECQSKKIDKIVFAIYGDEDAKVKGMADIIHEHDKYIQNDRKFKWGVAGALGASSGGLWVYIKTTLGI